MAETVARRERRGLLTVFALVGFIILCGLGTWQVQRLLWKQDLIATVERRISLLSPEAAFAPAEWPTIDYDEVDYLPVTVTGTFRHDQEAHVYAALTEPNGAYGGQGYFVLTPLETTDGWTVIVNRGFVPDAFKEPGTRAAGQVTGEVEVTGLLRQPQGRNAFTPADDVDDNIWFTRDPATIGVALGIPEAQLAPYYIDAYFDPDLPGGLPQGGETVVSFSNNHLQYAVTWFGLALALAVIFVLRVRRRRPAG